MVDLPQVHQASYDEIEHGKCCQGCDHWLRYPNSYVAGVCTLAGVRKDPLRWTDELDICSGFKEDK